MSRSAGWTLLVLLAVCGVAQGKQQVSKQSRWGTVEALPQGTLIEVGQDRKAGVDVCRVESAGGSALTCVAERPDGDARLVFPRYAVRDVWVIERARNLHIGRWVGVAIEVTVVVAGFVGSGVLGGLFMGGLVLLVEGVIAEDGLPSRPPRLHHRLVYTAP